jgi:hypothetical protein
MQDTEKTRVVEEIGTTIRDVLAGLFRWHDQTVNMEPYNRFVRLFDLCGRLSPIERLRNDIGYSYRNLTIDFIGNDLVVVRRNND